MFKYTKYTLALMVLTAAFVVPKVFASAIDSLPSRSKLTSVERSADRLAERLERTGKIVDRRVLAKVIAEQRAFLQGTMEIQFSSSDGKLTNQWSIALQDFPQWLKVSRSLTAFAITFDEQAIEASLRTHIASFADAPVTPTLSRVETGKDGILRAVTDGIARSGHTVDTASATHTIARALESDSRTVEIPLVSVAASVTNASDFAFSDLTLLARGRSDFTGSGVGRKSNVRKGLAEKLNGIVVEPGATFSFNDVVGPISLSYGWKDALVIFNGKDLELAPGGGICQVVTTLYRSVLLAGLPVTERANHSLFVSYYEKHGVGMDATIFPGKQDFTFVNDTGAAILIQAESVGDEAFVSLYGRPDGRQTALEGPFFSTTVAHQALTGRTLKTSEIAWVRRVDKADGQKIQEVIVSRYGKMPRSISTKYPEASIVTQETAVHAAAPDEVSFRN